MHLSARVRDWPWLMALALPTTAFAAYYGKALATSGDNLLHLYRLVVLHKNILEGNFYPRWTSELFLGYGYPLLNFYASSTYYVAELLHLLGLDYANALIYTLFVLLIIAGLGMYRLATDIFAELGADNPAPALLATTAYVFAPYLLFNLYIRGAIAELGAQALLPWVLWSCRCLLRGDEPARDLLWASASLAALALTHTVSLVLVPPIIIAYALALLWRAPAQVNTLQRLGWLTMTAVSAGAVTAFFLLPAFVERHALATQAQEAAAQNLPANVWYWANFLTLDWPVAYTDAAVPSLHLVQLLLAVAGCLMVRHWNTEWGLLVAIAVAASLLIGAWAIPLWTSHSLLLTVQFPWRLLAIVTLSLSLLTGGILTRGLEMGWRWQTLGLIVVGGLIIYTNFPRLAWLNRLEVDPAQINLTSIAQYEAITTRYGLSAAASREFMPRWVNDLTFQSAPSEPNGNPTALQLDDATPQAWHLTTKSTQPARLLFSAFYFPGWQAELADGQPLAAYPTGDMGLLAVDLPAGEHRLSVEWAATPVRQWGRAVSLLTFALLGLYYLARARLRHLAIVPLAPLFVVAALSVLSPRLRPPYYATPDQPVEADIQLLGYTTYQEDATAIYLFPQWYVQAVPTDLMFHWSLLDQAGHEVAHTHSYPYFNTLRAFQWSANMLVDDAYYLPLPPGLVAGDYTLALAVAPPDRAQAAELPPIRQFGRITIRQDVPPLPEFAHPFDVEFNAPGDKGQITLRGFDVTSNAIIKDAPPAPVTLLAAPGDMLTYTLSWQSAQAVPDGVQLFHQLLDHQRTTLTQVHQPLQLSRGAPYYLWNPYWVREIRLQLTIPTDAPGGLYWPYIGIYYADTQMRFAASEPDGTPIGDGLLLPPIKVLRTGAPPLAQAAHMRFGESIQLESYELTLPPAGLQAGATMTLTVQYRSLAPTQSDYTQFVHLHDPNLGMAAQVDAPPLSGGNPTSTWLPGEVIVDTIPLQIAAGAMPGRYTLSLGLYDPAAGSARLPVIDQQGQPQPDNRVILTQIEIN